MLKSSIRKIVPIALIAATGFIFVPSFSFINITNAETAFAKTGDRVDYEVGVSPVGVVFDNVTNSIWMTNWGSDTVSKININNGVRVDYAVGSLPRSIAFDNVTNSIWVANNGHNTISKVNIYTGVRTDYVVEGRPLDIAFDNITNSVWFTTAGFTNVLGNIVGKMDINTGTRIDYFQTLNPLSIIFDDITNSMWGGSYLPFVSKINIFTDTRTDYATGLGKEQLYGITFDNVTNSVWAASSFSSTISKVNIFTGAMSEYAVGVRPYGVAFDNVTNSVWVTNQISSTVSKVDIYTGTRVDYPVGNNPVGVAFDNVTNSVWVANSSSNTVSKISIGAINATNIAPILSYSLESGYESDVDSPGIHPNKGTASSTSMVFKIVYTDADNDAPSATNVVVSNGISTTTYPMFLDTTTASSTLRDSIWSNGEQFVATSTFPKGTYQYYFEVSDGTSTKRLPEIGALTFEIGYSNVVFLPGLEASRLYQHGALFENKLWEPNQNDDVRKLYLNPDGTPQNNDIYTRDIIGQAFGFNVYAKFIDSMDKLVTDGVINEWKSFPYDWRHDQISIANKGILLESGKVYRMIEEIEKLAQASDTGKVTLITHSNGGLVGKALTSKLEEQGKAGLIDKVIMVAAPQLGTPEALSGLLHGGQRGILKGWLPSYETFRELAENMRSAYNLLPSRSYFNVVDTNAQPIVEFSTTTGATGYLRSMYGNTITSFDALLRFLAGEAGVRAEPSPGNVDEPNILSTQFLDRAETDHTFFDYWTAPNGIEIIQIAGWGLDTLRGIRYEGQRKTSCNTDLSVCSKIEVLDPRPLFTVDGDKTVVVPSATAMGGQKFYVNLPEQNREFRRLRRNREHSDILEIQELQDLIKDIIQDDGTLASYKNISFIKPESKDEDKKLRIRVHSPVSLDLYDAEGNHTGLLENPNLDSDIRLFEENIPNSYYLEMGEGKYAGSNTSTTTRIVLEGESLGTFTLEIDEVSGDTTTGTLRFKDIPVTASSTITMDIQTIASTTPLQIDLNSDGVVDFTLPSSTFAVSGISLEMLARIIQDMDIKSPFKEKLIKDIEKIQKHLKKETEHNKDEDDKEKEDRKKILEDFLHLEQDVRKFVKKNILSRDDGEKLLQMIGMIREGVIK